MGDDLDNEFQRLVAEYEQYFTINNSFGQAALEYRPATVTPIAYQSPILQYYNSLCSPEITEERSDAFQQFIKAEKKREEKERNYKEFKEFTRMLERTYCN